MTLKQAELMESMSIVPMVLAELDLDIAEVHRRGLMEKIKPNKSETTCQQLQIRVLTVNEIISL